ncbi:hypothetical protein [Kitasatospora fiedleri]|uniref:hypothetical protein n=1 Tax=Kitasatospora fiedleri TaxID=2991545 RepID=UPI00249BDB81|nr:hypothetical protein [Kitasatospora fiedleri]
MSRRPLPRRVRIDGEVLVVISEKEYEGLLATRRQVGAIGARTRVLQQALADALARLALAEGGGGAPDREPS